MSRLSCKMFIPEENRHIQIDLAGCMKENDVVVDGDHYYTIAKLSREGDSCEGSLVKFRKVGTFIKERRESKGLGSS